MNVHTSAHIPPIHKRPTSLPGPPLTSSAVAHASTPMQALASRPTPGPFAMVSSIIRTHGMQGLWLGHSATILRETGGTSIWFVVKEWTAQAMRERRLAASNASPDPLGTVPADITPWESLVSGALAGGLCVLAFYPVDTVKSAMQTEEELSAQRHRRILASSWSLSSSSPSVPVPPPSSPPSGSFWGVLGRMVRVHGVRGLYAGCGMTVARAVPSSGIVFVIYDGLSAWIK